MRYELNGLQKRRRYCKRIEVNVQNAKSDHSCVSCLRFVYDIDVFDEEAENNANRSF